MELDKAYMDIGARSVSAVQLTITSLPEVAAFHCYHAFESLGGALCEHHGISYPFPHAAKINSFVKAASKLSHHFQLAVSKLAIQLQSLRNLCLYPELTGSGMAKAPKEQLTSKQASELQKSVKGIEKRLRRYI